MNSVTKKTYKLTVTAMLSAIAFVLMFIEVAVPIIPNFIKFDISDLPAIFGAFALGPIYGPIIQLIKNVLHIIIKFTPESYYVGELSNFILGSIFTFVAGIIYKRNKTKKNAIIGSVIGAFAMGIACLPINYFIIYPAYVKVLNFPLNTIIGMYQAILGSVESFPTNNALFNCLLIFNVPFTTAKGLIVAFICLLVYKPLSNVIKKKI